MSDQLNNDAAPLRNNPKRHTGRREEDASGTSRQQHYQLHEPHQSSPIPITVKKTDFKDLKTGDDFRAPPSARTARSAGR